jgi:endonuclease/exonuclease/phosphatase family metal-dependent hydrolase
VGRISNVRLATFNILHGRSPVDGVVDLDRFADAVRTLDADVLALQEVDRDQPRSQLADLTAVAAEAMGAQSHRFVAALAGTPGLTWTAATGDEQPGTATYGVALVSRYPAQSWQVMRLPPIKARFPMYSRGAGRFIVVDEEPRVAVAGLFETPAGELTAVSTHLSFVPGWNRVQLRRLRRDLLALPDPLVLMGDLNMAGDAPRRLTGYRPLARFPTFPSDAPTRQLDHILLRGPLGDVTAAQAPELPLSDHRPLVAEVNVLR